MKAITAAILALVISGAVSAQTGAGNEATYQPRHRPVEELAELIRKVLPVDIKIAGDKLILRGDDEALVQADQFLHRLDRTPRKFAVQFFVAQIAPKSAQDAEFAGLTGPMDQVATKLEVFRKEGRLLEFKRYVVEAVDGQKATLKDERAEQIATRVQALAGQERITYQARAVGTQITLTPRSRDAQGVSLELMVRDSRIAPDGGGAALGVDAKGQAIRTPAILNEHVSAALALTADRVQVVRGMARPGRSRLLVVVAIGKTE